MPPNSPTFLCRRTWLVNESFYSGVKTLRFTCNRGRVREFRCGIIASLSSAPSTSTSMRVSKLYQSSSPYRRPSIADVRAALDVLGVSLDMDAKAWKSRYRQLVKQYHPDAGGDAELMTKVTVAYDILTSLTAKEKAEFRQTLQSQSVGTSGPTRSCYRHRGAWPSYAYTSQQNETENVSSSTHKPYHEEPPDHQRYTRERDQKDAFWSFYARHSTQGNYRSTGSKHAKENASNHYGRESSTFDPFQFHFGMRPLQRARRMQPSQLIGRALAVYFLVLSVVVVLYRFWRDRRLDKEWRFSENLVRNERFNEIYRLSSSTPDGSNSGSSAPSDLYLPVDHRALWRVLRWRETQREKAGELGWPDVPRSAGQVQQLFQDMDGITTYSPLGDDQALLREKQRPSRGVRITIVDS